jgi:hypothetical protein
MSFFQRLSLSGSLVTLAAAPSPASAAINGDVLTFIASPPLWRGSTTEHSGVFDFKEDTVTIMLDHKKACGDIVFDRDNGWLCKANGHVAAGKHVVAVNFTDNKNKPHRLRATLTLRAEDKKFEMPDNPTGGEQFWCVSITMTKIALMPKSDGRCHTD